MGRNSAGASFLKGYFLHGKPDQFWVYSETSHKAQLFANALSENRKRTNVKFISWKNFAGIKEPGNIFFPGPHFNSLAWQRRFVGDAAWSICGITHTTASKVVMDALGGYYTSPVTSWDALICTSNAVKANVDYILEKKRKYLADELGISNFVGPQLPIIPLGINTSEFDFSQKDREKARSFFRISKDTVTIVYVGRLSYHAKANPVPMYLAIEEAARLNPKRKIIIIECGWDATDGIRDTFSELANRTLDLVKTIFVDGRDQDRVKMVWSAGDIYCSFSDNIQETFGISPIEAMASGLPVVVSDWNGYKESIRDEVDGFRVSTTMPTMGFGNELAISHSVGSSNYDQYIGKASAYVALDIQHAVKRFDQLIKSRDLRINLGEMAKKRAYEKYDWRHIIPQYEDLWASLAEERTKHLESSTPRITWPERPDPFASFSHYATKKLIETDKIEYGHKDYDSTMKAYRMFRKLKINSFLKTELSTDEEIELMIKNLESGGNRTKDLLELFSETRQPIAYLSICWLLKMGIVKIST